MLANGRSGCLAQLFQGDWDRRLEHLLPAGQLAPFDWVWQMAWDHRNLGDQYTLFTRLRHCQCPIGARLRAALHDVF